MKAQLQALLQTALDRLVAESGQPRPDMVPQLESTRDPKLGDFASNAALALAKPLGKPPRAIAEGLVRHLPASPRVARVEIAGPGFINFFLTADAFQAVVPEILTAGERFGRDESGQRGRVLLEFVSANPTGPLHVGHGRGAAYGDALANILAAAGWQVSREYYVNDAGRQVDVLTISVWARYLQAAGEAVPVPTRGYPADYVGHSAERLLQSQGGAFVRPAAAVLADLPEDPPSVEGLDEADAARRKAAQEVYLDAFIVRAKALLGEGYQRVQEQALADQLATIRATLEAFGVRYDRWSSERELVSSGKVAHAMERLRAAGHVFEEDGALWLRTSAFGDEKDRVLFKADGSATYFANDIAYHVDKLERVGEGTDALLLDVWGADHHGYVARVRAALQALTGRPDALRVQLMQFVTLSSGRMGKRSGNFVTLQDLLNEAGKDATRFFYLLRSHDQHLEFDIELARAQNNDNPVFYVQYACARIASVFRQAAERGIPFDPQAPAGLQGLTEPHEKQLLVQLGRYPEAIQAAAAQFTPHSLGFYLRELADAFHSYYNAHPFLVDDAALRDARLALVAATGVVFRAGLGLLGVTAPERM